MAPHPVNVISLCSGGGGLDAALRLALPAARTVCYVENEITAAAVLEKGIESGYLEDAPVWSDLKTFDHVPWRGLVDGIIGGYPCQPFSFAGKRRGADDPRHLWPYVEGLVDSLRPEFCFFENVEGHLAQGYWDIVHPALSGMGYRVTQGLFSAREVGAGHRRRRLFILAVRGELHSVAHSRYAERREDLLDEQLRPEWREEASPSGGARADVAHAQHHARQQPAQREHPQRLDEPRGGDQGVADSDGEGLLGPRVHLRPGGSLLAAPLPQRGGGRDDPGALVADAGRSPRGAEQEREHPQRVPQHHGGSVDPRDGGVVADSPDIGLQRVGDTWRRGERPPHRGPGVADANRLPGGERLALGGQDRRTPAGRTGASGLRMDDPGSSGRQQDPGRPSGDESPDEGGSAVDDHLAPGQGPGDGDPYRDVPSYIILGNPYGERRDEALSGEPSDGRPPSPEPAMGSPRPVADAERERGLLPSKWRLPAVESPRTLSSAFPPGPTDTVGWRTYLSHGGPAPTTTRAESIVRGGADGMAFRADRLHVLGNGVVPSVGAKAFVSLATELLVP